jgi:HlyD family secretion protein
MAEQKRTPFRQKSLERLSSPERLDQLLRVIDRKSWLPLAALAILVTAAMAWSILGRVPVNAHGRGILVRPGEMVEIESPGDGYLDRLNVTEGDSVEPGTVLASIARPDLEQELTLQRAKAQELVEQLRVFFQDQGIEQTASTEDRRESGIRPHIEASRALARRLRVEGLELVEEERRRLQEQKRLAVALADTHRERLDSRQNLHEDGIFSREDLVDAKQSWTEALEGVADLDAEIWALRTRELELEEEYLQRLERISDREQQYTEVVREIARLESLLVEEGQIVAEHRCRVLEVSAAVGEYLEEGDRIGSMLASDPSTPFVALAYFTVRDGKRMRPGMPIQVSPDPVERERHGSILGTVISISDYPVTLSEAWKEVGNREVAETLVAGGYRMQVVAELETDPSTYSKFRWSSSRGPELEITAGTTATARVAVERRAPITFVLPFLRAAAGID